MKVLNLLCEYCEGNGYVEFLVNYNGFYFNGDEPIIERYPCKECEKKAIKDENN